MIPANIDRQLLKVQKPARYCGGEPGSVQKDRGEVDLRFAFCFPDLYEVGMSHLGMKILYSLINVREGMWCERVFAPDTDFEEIMRRENIPLYGLESFDPIREFDVIGFTLQYEMCYTTVLNMLDLAGLPVRAEDRGEDWPLVIGGGPCACAPEPVAGFFDLFQLGEGEELMLEMLDLLRQAKREGLSKSQFLRQAARIPGIYVPSLYDVTYREDGVIQAVTPREGTPARVQKRIVKDLSTMFFPNDFVVPFTEAVHDRAMVEVLRGCIRGCRFCQAGYIY
ncbi:MAG: B12-binding domain-containing radical SAM protein, partial [Angelakisella sp.]|nr:B12-binding domain-containing radical SAM protein [Angelakisella sp.]